MLMATWTFLTSRLALASPGRTPRNTHAPPGFSSGRHDRSRREHERSPLSQPSQPGMQGYGRELSERRDRHVQALRMLCQLSRHRDRRGVTTRAAGTSRHGLPR